MDGVCAYTDLQWNSTPSEVMKTAHQHLHFLSNLKRMNLKRELVTSSTTVPLNVLRYCISVWFLSCTIAHREALKGSLTESKTLITGHLFPSLEETYHCGDLHTLRTPGV